MIVPASVELPDIVEHGEGILTPARVLESSQNCRLPFSAGVRIFTLDYLTELLKDLVGFDDVDGVVGTSRATGLRIHDLKVLCGPIADPISEGVTQAGPA